MIILLMYVDQAALQTARRALLGLGTAAGEALAAVRRGAFSGLAFVVPLPRAGLVKARGTEYCSDLKNDHYGPILLIQK